jgi:O-antigen biosynthesis protein
LGRLAKRAVRLFGGKRRSSVQAANQFRHMIALAQAAETQTSGWAPSGTPPLISFVVPCFEAKRAWLDDLLASFRRQPAALCELVISDDGSLSHATRRWLSAHQGDDRVVIVRNEKNRGIAAATNAGLAQASGEWIGLLDHDDALAPFAVSRIAEALAQVPACQFLYTDEAVTDAALRPVDLFLKPAWDPALLSGVNYVNHLSLYRRDRLLALGGLRDGFQGSQDYDLLLRYTADLARDEIRHLPYPAYLWRRDDASFSSQSMGAAIDSARRALAEHYARDGEPLAIDRAISATLHRPRFDLARRDWPLVSVVIPNRDAYPLISRVLNGLTERTDYPRLEIIVVDNGSTDERVLTLYETFCSPGVRFVVDVAPAAFNFSRAVNRGVALAKGERVLLLNNDVEILDSGWLKEMESCFDYPDVGIVGAKLLYPSRKIQHVGVIAGLGVAPSVGRLVGHWYVEREENFPGPMGRLWVRQSLSAVTGACLMASRACFDRTGPFDERLFAIAYNDVDFCLRAVALGYRVVWTPFATLLHHESASRGSDETEANVERFRREQRNLLDRHRTDLYEDPAFSPWYSRDRSEPVPVRLASLPKAR